jgi:hypothetical protein
VRYSKEDELLNLHFKTLGLDYYVARSRLLATGLGTRDRANQWGYHYDWPDEKIAEIYTALQNRAFDVIAAGEQAAHKHLEPRWWRPDWRPDWRPGKTKTSPVT